MSTAQTIIHAVCEVCEVTEADLKSRIRLRKVCDARKIVSQNAYASAFTQRAIGEMLGGRDHSTIAVHLQKYRELFDVDKNFKNKALRVQELLNKTT